MPEHTAPGQIVILNGAPRSGKSSIAAAIQGTFDGMWMNLGVDHSMATTPARVQPGIGLRPGGERPDLEAVVAVIYRALYASIAAHSRLGLNVAVDVGHHDRYSAPLGILPACARILAGLPVLFVGVLCPVEVIMARRIASGWNTDWTPGDPIPPPVLRWQEAVHSPGVYDLTLDTAQHSPAQCATLIRQRLQEGPPGTALAEVARFAPQA